MKEIYIFSGIEQITDFVINKWTDLSEKAINEKGVFSVALSGGKTPEMLYQKLTEKTELPWNKTHIFMVDERFVPYESSESNFRMISQSLLRHVTIPAKNIHFISTTDDTPQTSALKYENDLISYFKKTNKNSPGFDLILLGIGSDGHTASLFPSSSSLKVTRHLVMAVSPADKTGEKRITLTLPVINKTKDIYFLVTGEGKADTIKKVLENKNSVLPAAMVKPDNGNLFFLLDNSAASMLSARR